MREPLSHPHKDKFVDSFATSMVLAWIALNVLYCEMANNQKLGLYWSLQFADKAKRLAIDSCGPSGTITCASHCDRNSISRNVYVPVIEAYAIVIKFLISAGRVDVVQLILSLPKLHQWSSVFPLCKMRLKQLIATLADEQQRQAKSAAKEEEEEVTQTQLSEVPPREPSAMPTLNPDPPSSIDSSKEGEVSFGSSPVDDYMDWIQWLTDSI